VKAKLTRGERLLLLAFLTLVGLACLGGLVSTLSKVAP
jgi:hypothetical protein